MRYQRVKGAECMSSPSLSLNGNEPYHVHLLRAVVQKVKADRFQIDTTEVIPEELLAVPLT
jgi:hypothetical protein